MELMSSMYKKSPLLEDFLLLLMPIILSMPMIVNAHETKAEGQWQQQFKQVLKTKLKQFNDTPNSNKLIIASGNKTFYEGSKFSSSQHWLGLYCSNWHCKWIPAKLKVKQESIWVGEGKYDAGYEEVKGQLLTFETKEPQFTTGVVMWVLKKPNSPKWLQEATVKTYYATSSLVSDDDNKNHTFEQQFKDDKGEIKKIVPQKLLTPSVDVAANETFLQLVQGEKKQFFLSSLSIEAERECQPADVNTANNYLFWAGDMDHDGKTDYLINFSANGDNVHLYLSGVAKQDETVALTGVFDAKNCANSVR